MMKIMVRMRKLRVMLTKAILILTVCKTFLGWPWWLSQKDPVAKCIPGHHPCQIDINGNCQVKISMIMVIMMMRRTNYDNYDDEKNHAAMDVVRGVGRGAGRLARCRARQGVTRTSHLGSGS